MPSVQPTPILAQIANGAARIGQITGVLILTLCGSDRPTFARCNDQDSSQSKTCAGTPCSATKFLPPYGTHPQRRERWHKRNITVIYYALHTGYLFWSHDYWMEILLHRRTRRTKLGVHSTRLSGAKDNTYAVDLRSHSQHACLSTKNAIATATSISH